MNIFISYAREDSDMALEIYDLLKRNGFSPWLDTKDLMPGENWEDIINKTISNCEIFIACLSNASVSKRGYVQAELKKALKVVEQLPQNEIFLIPLRFDNCQIPQKLTHIHALDYFTETAPTKLINVIKQHIGIKNRKSKRLTNSDDKEFKTNANHSIIELDYFNIDTQKSKFKISTISQKDKDLHLKFYQDLLSHAPADLKTSLTKKLKNKERAIVVGIPKFVEDNEDKKFTIFKSRSEYPIFIFTIHNPSSRKISLNTIELEVIDIEEYMGIGDSGAIKSLGTYDVIVPRTEKSISQQISPQLGIAPGDIISFYIRLLPPKAQGMRTKKDYCINIRIKGSNHCYVESGVFHVDLLT